MKNTRFYIYIIIALILFVGFKPIKVSAYAIAVPSNFLGTSAYGLVGWWTMDGKDTVWSSATEATTIDKSGNSNTGTLTNMVQSTSTVPGKIGQAVKFQNNYITVADSSSLNVSNVTLAAWVKTTTTSRYIMAKDPPEHITYQKIIKDVPYTMNPYLKSFLILFSISIFLWILKYFGLLKPFRRLFWDRNPELTLVFVVLSFVFSITVPVVSTSLDWKQSYDRVHTGEDGQITKTYHNLFYDSFGKKYEEEITEEEYLSYGKRNASQPHKKVFETLLKSLPAMAAISFNIAGTDDCTACTSLTYGETVGAGSNTVLVVGATAATDGSDPADSFSSITFNGVSMTPQTDSGNGNALRVVQYTLVAPDASVQHNIVINKTTSSTIDNIIGSDAVYFGVDQTSPVETSNTAKDLGASTAVSVTVAGMSATSMIVDHACAGTSFAVGTGANQTERSRNNVNNSKACFNGVSSEQSGADGGVMSWTVSGSDSWGISAIALKAAGAGKSTADIPYAMDVTSTGKVEMFFKSSSNIYAATSTTSINDNKWHYLVGTYNGSAVRIYVDGVLEDTKVIASSLPSVTGPLRIGADWQSTPANFFIGNIDDARVYNRALQSYEITKLYNAVSGNKIDTAQVGPDDLNSGLVGWWTMDGKNVVSGTIRDSSGQGNTGNLSGIATSTFYVAGKTGQAFNFDGVNDYVAIADSSTLRSTQGTVVGWIKTTSDDDEEFYGASYGGNSALNFGVELGANVTGQCTNELITVVVNGVNGETNTLCYTTATRSELFDGKWHHIAVAVGTDQLARIFLDGVSKTVTVGLGSNHSLFTSDTNIDTFRIGELQINNTDVNFLGGTLDNMRLYNRGLSASEISTLYTTTGGSKADATQVGPANLNSGLVGWWTFDGKSIVSGTARDSSGQANTGLMDSIATSTFYSRGKIGQGLKFDGVDDTIGLLTDKIGTGALTTTAWVILPVLGNGEARVVISNISYQMAVWGTNLGLVVAASNDSGATNVFSADPSVTANKWQHIAVVRNSSGTVTFYINGEQNGTANQSAGTPSAAVLTGGYMMTIGRRIDPAYFFNGRMDDVRIYNRTLSAKEIRQLYNSGL